MSDNFATEPEEIAEISVIPVTDRRTKDGRFEHRLPPLSQTTNAQEYLEGRPDVVHLPPDAIRRIVYGAVEPDQLENIRVERHRVETGWLMMISYRAYTTMISPAIENDRLLADAHYAADPHASESRTMALSMPDAHDAHAVLVHKDGFTDIVETVDHSARSVLAGNRQEVGARIVERPLTLVPATFTGADGKAADDVTTVDGNCRLCSCQACITVAEGWVDDSLPSKERHKQIPLRPSHLMRLSLEGRRELTRNVIRAAHQRLAKTKTGTAYDRMARNQAASTLNAITVPVQAIVGYIDDDPERGMQRFPVAVRTLLMRMNVGVTPFSPGAKHAVSAEEIITGLHDEGLLSPTSDASAWRDALIGRGSVAPAMEKLGLDPSLPDLRFALVVQQLTRKSPRFNALMRSKLSSTGNLTLGRRNGPVVELGLRSYSSRETKSARTALETICLWQDLVTQSWSVDNVNTDEEVDALLARAESGDISASLLLGTLGMIALVMSGYLLAPAGSAEAITGTTIDRSSVGDIIRKLLTRSAGRLLLADAIKRTRAGETPRWYDEDNDQLVLPPSDWKGSTYNAYLRGAVRHGFKLERRGMTNDEREANALTKFQEGLVEADQRLRDLKDMRDKNGTTDRLRWTEVEASFNQIKGLERGLRRIAEDEPEEQ
ncbi:hypothetical protein [Streptomyces sasae]|uniref:hypothetical protein n=1 Tax=Streptomyces sasae TaxID=1266772 RepID=UPI002930103A|nr:hypothetical protein [Streptomyces sasae]